jgi:hypothetical protein
LSHPSEKYEFVSWDDDILIYEMEIEKCSKPPTSLSSIRKRNNSKHYHSCCPMSKSNAGHFTKKNSPNPHPGVRRLHGVDLHQVLFQGNGIRNRLVILVSTVHDPSEKDPEFGRPAGNGCVWNGV